MKQASGIPESIGETFAMSQQILDIEVDLSVAGDAVAETAETGLDWTVGHAIYLFFYPGNWLIDLFTQFPRLAFVGEYFGMSMAWYGGWFSAAVGTVSWALVALMLWRGWRRFRAA